MIGEILLYMVTVLMLLNLLCFIIVNISQRKLDREIKDYLKYYDSLADRISNLEHRDIDVIRIPITENMRSMTDEELASYKKSLKKIFKPTGRNFFDEE